MPDEQQTQQQQPTPGVPQDFQKAQAQAQAPAPKVEDADTWKNRFEDAVRTRDEAKSRNRELTERLTSAEQKLQEIEAKSQQIQEERKRAQLEQEGKYSEALQLTEQKHVQNYQKLSGLASSKLVPMSIRSAAAGIETLTPEAISDLPQLLRDRIKLDPNTLDPTVLGDDGKPMTDESLKPVTVEAYVREFVKTRPYLHKASVPAKHGIMAQAGGDVEYSIERCKDSPAKMARWATEDPTGYAAAVREYYSPESVQRRMADQK